MTYVKVLRPTCAQECSAKSDKVTYFVEEYHIEVECILMSPIDSQWLSDIGLSDIGNRNSVIGHRLSEIGYRTLADATKLRPLGCID